MTPDIKGENSMDELFVYLSFTSETSYRRIFSIRQILHNIDKVYCVNRFSQYSIRNYPKLH